MAPLFSLVFLAFIPILVSSAPLINLHASHVIPDQYIVVFHHNTSVQIRDGHVSDLTKNRLVRNERILNVFDVGSVIGYCAILSKENLARELEHPNIRYIEVDQVVTTMEDNTVQQDAIWNLDRIDQRALPLSTTYTYFNSGGAKVSAYVVDTGILLSHTEFEGRAVLGFNAVPNDGNSDNNGHGTHIAATIGGKTYGVAKNVALVAVKVLDAGGSGSFANVIAGVDYITKDHQSRANARSVANLSLGGSPSPTLDSAIENSITAGVSYSVAAGGSAASACNYSPARIPSVITVGSTTSSDVRASSSNFGPCVDIFAPGSLIKSAWISSNTATNTISGTSMATAHAAGVVAVHLGHLLAEGNNTPVPPAEIQKWIQSNATAGVISDVGSGSPNLLLFSPYQ